LMTSLTPLFPNSLIFLLSLPPTLFFGLSYFTLLPSFLLKYVCGCPVKKNLGCPLSLEID
ncbi:MAG: hypothetical protein ACKO2V_06365, partial [Snowella sp.]